ncbi:MAG: helix-turn-helix transcriptional regulator [Oscillibacter sp.]|nr:helix-turn-helix transcriptional regulator [Oscillibacter sp.]
MILSERLKQLRNEHRLTQQNLADQLGVKLRTYQYYESDTDRSHRPDLETLVVLADFYGVSVDYLIGRSDVK